MRLTLLPSGPPKIARSAAALERRKPIDQKPHIGGPALSPPVCYIEDSSNPINEQTIRHTGESAP